MVGVRMQAAAYRGRMKEAATLAVEWQERMDAASRRQQTGQGICGLAINEALAGLVDSAKTRVAKALDEELLLADAIDERLVVAAVTTDGALARELLPQALAEFKKDNSNSQALRGERALQALAEFADGKPAETIALLEPISFDAQYSDVIGIWTIAQFTWRSSKTSTSWSTTTMRFMYMSAPKAARMAFLPWPRMRCSIEM